MVDGGRKGGVSEPPRCDLKVRILLGGSLSMALLLELGVGGRSSDVTLYDSC